MMQRKLSAADLAIIGLGAATGVIHLALGAVWGDLLLLLNGGGYLGLIGLLYLPLPLPEVWRGWARYVLIGYTAITIVGYVVTHSLFDAIGVATKVVELLLIMAVVVRLGR